MKYTRLDRKLEIAVNRGLAAALLADVHAGVRLMNDERVPPDVVARVILDPQRRRASDWKR
ncbi:MAG TPA: hypothetical protein VFF82_07905 [Rhodocyclaceae bacterium]|nr:hypothetical protein [Rhodocyclaceae bacterium]